MKSFEYATPRTVDEVVELLADKWGETEVLAGGTDLVTCLKQGLTTPARVVSLKAVKGLKGISSSNGALTIGAMTAMGQLADNADVQKHFPALATAAKNIGSPQLLSTGTVGGDLCQRPRCWYFRNGYGLLAQKDGQSLVTAGDNRYHAIFGNGGAAKFVSASSLGPALIALGATVKTSSREIGADKFFQTPKSEDERETALKPNEIITEISVPIGAKNATYEVRHRKGLDWPYVTASVAQSAGGTKIVLGHVAPTPVAVTGNDPVAGAKPLSGNAYKVPMVKTAVKRALAAASN